MADENRGNEICSFFIYDHSVLKREEDDLKDAIIYFWPYTVSVDNQCALVGKLIGISDFFFNTLPESPPKVIKLCSEKFATRREGEFTIGLGCDLYIPDAFITRHLDFVWKVFVFFQGSLPSVQQRSKSHQSFPTELAKIWDLYLPVCQFYGDLLSQAFQILPDVQLPKENAYKSPKEDVYSIDLKPLQSSCKTFLHASHILQRSHRQPGVLGGAILHRSKVLCTQLSPDITKTFLLLKPQQTHLPCQEIKTDFELPGGMRLIKVFLSTKEYNQLGSRRHHSLKSKPDHSTGDHTQLLYYDTDTQLSTGIPSVQCDSVASQNLTPPLKDTVQKILSGGEEFDDSESLEPTHHQSKPQVNTSKKPNQLDSLAVQVHEPGESGEITHMAGMVETISMTDADTDRENAMASQSRKGQDVDVRWVNGIRKSFSAEAELEVGSGEASTDSVTKDDDNLSCERGDNVTDSGSAFVGTATDTEVHTETDSKEQLLEQKQFESKMEESETETESEIKMSSDCEHPEGEESPGVHGEESPKLSDAKEDGDAGASLGCDNTDNVKDMSESDRASLKECELNPDSDVSEINATSKISEESKHDASVRDSQNVAENPNEDKTKEQLTLTVSSETASANTPESVNTSNYSADDETTHSDHIADITKDDNHVTQTTHNQPELVTVADSENDTVSPLLKSHDDGHFVLSSQTISSVSDDVMSSHKETLDFSEECENISSHHGASAGWAVKTPVAEIKDRHFLPSSESYVSSSYSHSESETSGTWMAERDGLVDLTLYAQGHSEMLLLLLLDNGVRCDKTLITELWKCSLAHLAELDFEVKENLESVDTDKFGAGKYYYLRYDSFTRNVAGNVLESVTGTAHEFVSTSANIHDTFQQNDTMTDILLRSQTSSVYGHRSVCHETFFQLNAQQGHSGGYPLPKDIAFNLDQLAAQKLQTDHDITLL